MTHDWVAFRGGAVFSTSVWAGNSRFRFAKIAVAGQSFYPVFVQSRDLRAKRQS